MTYRRMKFLVQRLPIQLNPKQLELISFQGEEALLGGAAGGGKTIAALVWLLEGVDIPGYNAAVFRKFQTDTKDDESALIAKAAQIYPAFGGKLVGFRWMFPKGSSIIMEGIAHENALLSKQGKEYHRVVFDELTHFTEMAYQFVTTTRMRKVVNFPIECGIRNTANPGGPGHLWVKERFITDDAIKVVRDLDVSRPTPYGMIFFKNKGTIHETAYLPSRAADNNKLDVADYIKRLSRNKNPVERARMMNGDWGISPEGLIKPHWLRYYTTRDQMVDLLISQKDDSSGDTLHTNQVLCSFHTNTCRRFITVDTAGGMADITAESKGKPYSWTVAGVWDSRNINGQAILICRHVWKDRIGFTEVAKKLVELNNKYKPQITRVEDKTMGPDLYNLLMGVININLIATGSQDKVERAHSLTNMLSEGRVYLPREEGEWRPGLEAEWLGWQGLKEETNDQVDMSAYAAIECTNGIMGSGTIPLDYDPRKPFDLLPGASKVGSGKLAKILERW